MARTVDDLPLAALCNEGDVTAVLVAVSRRPSIDGEDVSGA